MFVHVLYMAQICSDPIALRRLYINWYKSWYVSMFVYEMAHVCI